jgi:very-short-patch-repair endonuclease
MHPAIKARVRELRKKQTETEKIIWELVRNRHIKGQKFLRQHPFVFEYENRKRLFVADFYCAEKHLVVEIDGKIHENQKEHDRLRDYLMQEMDLTVMRFTNNEVQHDLEGVLRKLESVL